MEECRMRCRLIILLLLLVLVFPFCACAEEDMLYPALGEQELWGYINIRGEWVIPPQYEAAHEFGKGRYTMVSTVDGFDGIIDRQGNWIVEPHYFIAKPDYYGNKPEDEGKLWLIMEKDAELYIGDESAMGFFDGESGFFSGIHKDMSIGWFYSESDLIPVVNLSDTDNTQGMMGYVNRRNGEQVIPFQYEADPEFCLFHDGVTVVYYPEEFEEERAGHLINEQGKPVPLDDGIEIVFGAGINSGRILVQDKATGLYGYIDTKGRLVIPAVYLNSYGFDADRAWVAFNETEQGVIDPDGNEIVPRNLIHGVLRYDHEYAKASFTDGTDGWISMDGRMIDKVSTDAKPVQRSRFWEYAGQKYYWYLTDEAGTLLSKKFWLFDSYQDYYFHEGVSPVQNENGLWGYVNVDGQEVNPCQWDEAYPFDAGLALVSYSDGKTAYIDHAGKIVWQEK